MPNYVVYLKNNYLKLLTWKRLYKRVAASLKKQRRNKKSN